MNPVVGPKLVRSPSPVELALTVSESLEGWAPPPQIKEPLAGALVPPDCPRIAARTLSTLLCLSQTQVVIVLVPGSEEQPTALISPPTPPTRIGLPLIDGSIAVRLVKALGPLASLDLTGSGVRRAEGVLRLLTLVKPTIRAVICSIPNFLTPREREFEDRFVRFTTPRPELGLVVPSHLTAYGQRHRFIPVGVGPTAESWTLESDAGMIRRIQSLDADEVLNEALSRKNLAQPQLLALALRVAVRRESWKGHLIEYSSSFLENEELLFEESVGFAGIVF